ncbi:MAG: radical SAM protein [Acidobacteriota bacterium]|nr:radical SAM protein [Acidobacteriota bacterium]
MNAKSFVSGGRLSRLSLWKKTAVQRKPWSFDLEITARCNNNCRHCYINLPANDPDAARNELSATEIAELADQAVALDALWCLITGGEPLLREDFPEIYISLKKKGLLISVFTNAALITPDHVALFKKFPPRDIEVTVYGTTQETYERVTGKPGSFAAFRQGLDLLLVNDIPVHLKAMAVRSNVHELPEIAAFCRRHTRDFFRFDPVLHLRYDGNTERNSEIISERLTPEEIAGIETSDEERSETLKKHCDKFIFSEPSNSDCRHLFRCGVGNKSFTISPNGFFHLCPSLRHPECIRDLKTTSLVDAWENFVPEIRAKTSSDPVFLEKCRSCPIINLCLWCPAHAHLETGQLDGWSEYFCQVAHARRDAIEESK